MHVYVHCSTSHNSKDKESTQMPINIRLDKENVVHMYHGILRSHKKELYYVLCSNMDGAQAIIISNLTPEQKTRHHMFSLISGT